MAKIIMHPGQLLPLIFYANLAIMYCDILFTLQLTLVFHVSAAADLTFSESDDFQSEQVEAVTRAPAPSPQPQGTTVLVASTQGFIPSPGYWSGSPTAQPLAGPQPPSFTKDAVDHRHGPTGQPHPNHLFCHEEEGGVTDDDESCNNSHLALQQVLCIQTLLITYGINRRLMVV